MCGMDVCAACSPAPCVMLPQFGYYEAVRICVKCRTSRAKEAAEFKKASSSQDAPIPTVHLSWPLKKGVSWADQDSTDYEARAGDISSDSDHKEDHEDIVQHLRTRLREQKQAHVIKMLKLTDGYNAAVQHMQSNWSTSEQNFRAEIVELQRSNEELRAKKAALEQQLSDANQVQRDLEARCASLSKQAAPAQDQLPNSQGSANKEMVELLKSQVALLRQEVARIKKHKEARNSTSGTTGGSEEGICGRSSKDTGRRSSTCSTAGGSNARSQEDSEPTLHFHYADESVSAPLPVSRKTSSSGSSARKLQKSLSGLPGPTKRSLKAPAVAFQRKLPAAAPHCVETPSEPSDSNHQQT